MSLLLFAFVSGILFPPGRAIVLVLAFLLFALFILFSVQGICTSARKKRDG